MITSPAFSGRRYAVLGLARSGQATIEALLAGGAECTVWDTREEARAAFADRCTIADPAEIDLAGFTGVVVSPGVPLNTHPIAAHAASFGLPVIGDIELFAEARASLPRHKVVGITGTNGKSTTTALIHHICKTAARATLMGGNIGLPILSQEPLPEGGIYVLELSSYQIDLTFSLACEVAVLLNITPDHLDRYDNSFDKYAAAKARLFAMQAPGGYAIVGSGDEASRDISSNLRHSREGMEELDSRYRGSDVIEIGPDDVHPDDQRAWPALQGPHNAENAAAAIAATRALNIDDLDIARGLASYPGLPHRMEIVGTRGGVTFINDSKATNPASTAPALAAWPPTDRGPRVHWILGGLPKGAGLAECERWFGHVAHAYTIGEAGPAYAQLLQDKMPVSRSETLGTAVKSAAAAARPGDIVLLSPACASFDQFRDFEARGEAFRALVEALDGGAEEEARSA